MGIGPSINLFKRFAFQLDSFGTSSLTCKDTTTEGIMSLRVTYQEQLLHDEHFNLSVASSKKLFIW